MIIVSSHKVRSVEPSAKIKALLPTISESQLRKWVEHISVPRHFGAEPEQNRATAEWLEGVFDSMGFRVERQGGFSNVKFSDRGDFLGLLANGRSSGVLDFVLRRARTYVPELPVMGLNVKLGLEKYFPVLSRSDHAPFWTQKIPAVMWTDTSEFRNHNYHRHTDTPDTLNYGFLRQVTQILTACVIQQGEELLAAR